MALIELGDTEIPVDQLTVPKARALAAYLQSGHNPYARLVHCARGEDPQRGESYESVVVDVDIEVPTFPVHDIRKTERLSIKFSPTDKNEPKVLSLRSDFPIVPHLNLHIQEFPRYICLYDEPYDVVKLTWTPFRCVERIREWLAKTAKGELHQEDQSLEPMLISYTGTLIYPNDLLQKCKDQGYCKLHAFQIPYPGDREFVIRAFHDQSGLPESNFILATFFCPESTHGTIKHTPKTLKELHDLTSEIGFDLIKELRSRLKEWNLTNPKNPFFAKKLILFFFFPRKRREGEEVEKYDKWAFGTVDTVLDVGKSLDIFQKIDATGNQQEMIGSVILPDPKRDGSDSGVVLLKPIPTLTSSQAKSYNESGAQKDLQATIIGVGALGSQVFSNLMRSGLFRWTIIDEDLLLPHNLVRHYSNGRHIGYAKAEIMAGIANSTYDEPPVAEYYACNLMRKSKEDEVIKATCSSDIILDCSVSVPFSRFIANDLDSPARRVSIFLNPTGTDSIILAEDIKRGITIDSCEMQYYRFIACNADLQEQLTSNSSQIRFANSCRDVTSEIPQSFVAMHSGLCSHAFMEIIHKDGARGIIFRFNPISLGVTTYEIPLYPVHRSKLGSWTILTDKHVINSLFEHRAHKLPNETGGILIGSIDLQRMIIYIVSSIPSPLDSLEYPHSFERGFEGLRERVEEISKVTLGNLDYVGEWHSHPDGNTTSPSSNDAAQLAWLAEKMEPNGLPALMIIAGKREFTIVSGNASSVETASITFGENHDEHFA